MVCVAQEVGAGASRRVEAVPPTPTAANNATMNNGGSDLHQFHHQRRGRRKQQRTAPKMMSSLVFVVSLAVLMLTVMSLGYTEAASVSNSAPAATLRVLAKSKNNYLRGRQLPEEEWEEDDDDDDVDIDEVEAEEELPPVATLSELEVELDEEEEKEAAAVAPEATPKAPTSATKKEQHIPCMTEEQCSIQATQLNVEFSSHDHPTAVGCFLFEGKAHWVEGGTKTQNAHGLADPKKERIYCDDLEDAVDTEGEGADEVEELVASNEEGESLSEDEATVSEADTEEVATGDGEGDDNGDDITQEKEEVVAPDAVVESSVDDAATAVINAPTETEVVSGEGESSKDDVADVTEEVVPGDDGESTAVEESSSVDSDADDVSTTDPTTSDAEEVTAKEEVSPEEEVTEALDEVKEDIENLEELEQLEIAQGESTEETKEEIEELEKVEEELSEEAVVTIAAVAKDEEPEVGDGDGIIDDISEEDEETPAAPSIVVESSSSVDGDDNDVSAADPITPDDEVEEGDGEETPLPSSEDDLYEELDEVEEELEALEELESLEIDAGNSTLEVEEQIEDLEELEEELIEEAMFEDYEDMDDDEFGDGYEDAFYAGDGSDEGEAVQELEMEIEEIEEEIEGIEEADDDGEFKEEKEEYVEQLKELEEEAEEYLEEEIMMETMVANMENGTSMGNMSIPIESMPGVMVDPMLTMDLTTMNPPPILSNETNNEAAGPIVKEAESPPSKMDMEPERVEPSGEVVVNDSDEAVSVESENEAANDAIVGDEGVPCLTQEMCENRATELGNEFKVKESSTKGCYTKNENKVYWVEGGTEEEMSSALEGSSKVRVWCDSVAAANEEVAKETSTEESETSVDETEAESASEAESPIDEKEGGDTAAVVEAETSSPTQKDDTLAPTVKVTTVSPTSAPTQKATAAPFPTSEPTTTDNDDDDDDDDDTTITSEPTSRPTVEYVEPNDDTLDPLANEPSEERDEAFEDGEAVPEEPLPGSSSIGSIEEDVEEEVKKVGGWLSFASLILMIYTAYQMSENPDGICASLCRLVITVVGCIIKILLIPFKYIMGGRQNGGHYMATPDYRDPYGSRHMELT